MIVDNSIKHMNNAKSKLFEYQNQISTGKAYQFSSDNPARIATSMKLSSTKQISEAYKATANHIDGWMSTTEFNLRQIVDRAITAKNGILKALNDTLGDGERQAIAVELDGIWKGIVDIANATHEGQYVFSGFQVQTKPFDYPAVAGDPIVFNGDSGTMWRDIGISQSIPMNYDGAQLAPLIDAIAQARDNINNGNMADLETTLGTLSAAYDTILESHTAFGARQRQVKSALDHIEQANLELDSLISKNEDVNMAEAISYFKNQEIAYQAVLEVSQRSISSLSLFNYLR
jgi:flagellar hook-associated protein 3 FlgL